MAYLVAIYALTGYFVSIEIRLIYDRQIYTNRFVQFEKENYVNLGNPYKTA